MEVETASYGGHGSHIGKGGKEHWITDIELLPPNMAVTQE